ncbi:hypothetical protein KUCAC02_033558 [Chaenocephalus aceratus]|nr:hypothetical protein KUCAC02_033558 [Chaenocephalus aceratus]
MKWEYKDIKTEGGRGKEKKRKEEERRGRGKERKRKGEEEEGEQDMECVLTAGSPGDGRSDGRERPQAAGSVLRRQGASSDGRERPQTAGSVLRRGARGSIRVVFI